MIINIQKYLSCTYNISLDTLKGKKGIRSKDEYKNQIIQRLGNALDILSEFDEKFDLVFIDADKKNYKNYFNKVLPIISSSKLILMFFLSLS